MLVEFGKCKVNIFRFLVRNLCCYSKPTVFFDYTFLITIARLTNRIVVH